MHGVALLFASAATPLAVHAQLEIGTWVRQTPAEPAITLQIEACCGGGRRLTYHISVGGKTMVLALDTKLDGSESHVSVDGKPTGETMAITREDAHHASTVVKMDGKLFGTSKGTLSADGKTLTVLGDFAQSVGGGSAGKSTEVWVKK